MLMMIMMMMMMNVQLRSLTLKFLSVMCCYRFASHVLHMFFFQYASLEHRAQDHITVSTGC